MATKLPLGRLEPINDLRDCWEKEDKDFTPWLSENLQLLGETVGMDFELEDTESYVGPFRADILCRDVNTDSYVLIENQLERTDHTHLGQLKTYAAGLDTVNIIWVAQRFTEEHRAALDWLNRITIEGFHFFGIEVELWKIGDSNAVSKFNIVSKPNDWTKTVKAGASISKTEIAVMYRQLWSSLIEYIEKNHPEVNVPKPTGMHWIRFPMKDTKVVMSYSAPKKQLSLYLLFRGEDPDRWYRFLKSNAKSFEDRFGLSFDWIDSEDDIGYALRTIEFDHQKTDTLSDHFIKLGTALSQIRKELEERNSEFSRE